MPNEAAQSIGSRHSVVPVHRKHLPEELCRMSQINDALPAWEQELAQHHLARAVADAGLRCVLVGDAADETHYGYPFLLDREATALAETHPAALRPAAIEPGIYRSNRLHALEDHYQTLAESAGHHWHTPLAGLLATTYLIMKRWLPRLLHNGDIHTMAFSVEARVPFADTDILELSEKVHPHLALRNGCEKYLLRQAAHGLMPEANRLRPKSALPKDQRRRAISNRGRKGHQPSGDFIGIWLDLH